MNVSEFRRKSLSLLRLEGFPRKKVRRIFFKLIEVCGNQAISGSWDFKVFGVRTYPPFSQNKFLNALLYPFSWFIPELSSYLIAVKVR
jgi:hypothetical protein